MTKILLKNTGRYL